MGKNECTWWFLEIQDESGQQFHQFLGDLAAPSPPVVANPQAVRTVPRRYAQGRYEMVPACRHPGGNRVVSHPPNQHPEFVLGGVKTCLNWFELASFGDRFILFSHHLPFIYIYACICILYIVIVQWSGKMFASVCHVFACVCRCSIKTEVWSLHLGWTSPTG